MLQRGLSQPSLQQHASIYDVCMYVCMYVCVVYVRLVSTGPEPRCRILWGRGGGGEDLGLYIYLTTYPKPGTYLTLGYLPVYLAYGNYFLGGRLIFLIFFLFVCLYM
ncbi:hypothetical protein F5Y11DRAFT_324211 [Daldinia sp. FL1419]|nr:hypothetical protein F5Y11DRAFT_324211 [Daldinia sp. FL1419]